MGRNDDGWHLAEGELLAPGLSALRRLGGGAAYEAWLCFDEVTWSPVVVKALRPSQLEDESSRRGLRREVLALATVNHPVVVRGLRDGQDGDRPHVVLEHIDGPRLSSLVRRHGRLQEQQYLPLAIDVAAALHYFRHIGWTHLDIKPSNVIMGAPARLIDLSVARPEEDARRLRHPIGTDAYMSPEQCDPGAAHQVVGPCRPTPPTCGAWVRRSSTRSPAGAPSSTATPTRTTYAVGSRSSWTLPRRCPTTYRPWSRRRSTPACAATPTTVRCPTRWPRRSSRCWPVCRAAR